MQVGVGVIALRKPDEILLMQRHNGEWELAGGKPDGKEWPLQTAVREMSEETGWQLSIHQLEYVGHYPHVGREEGTWWCSFYFLHCVPDEFRDAPVVLETRTHKASGWFKIDELPPETSRLVKVGLNYALGPLLAPGRIWGDVVRMPPPWFTAEPDEGVVVVGGFKYSMPAVVHVLHKRYKPP